MRKLPRKNALFLTHPDRESTVQVSVNGYHDGYIEKLKKEYEDKGWTLVKHDQGIDWRAVFPDLFIGYATGVVTVYVTQALIRVFYG